MAKNSLLKLDYFLPMALSNEADALTDIIGGKKAINNGATKVFEGFSFDGISSYIDSKYNPAIDRINYFQDNAQIDIFTFIQLNTGTLFGSSSKLLQNGTYSINGGDNPSTTVTDKSLNSAYRTGSTSSGLVKDGVIAYTNTGISSPIISSILNIGSNNTVGNYFNGTISLFSAGAAIGVDQAAKNNHYRQFLEDLGISLTP